MHYRRDPSLIGHAFPSSLRDPTSMRDVDNQRENWREGNEWSGILGGCGTVPTDVPIGAIDPRTGLVNQATYLVQDFSPRAVQGTIEVKRSHLVPHPGREQAYQGLLQCGANLYNRARFGAPLAIPSDLYNQIRLIKPWGDSSS